MVDIVLAVGVSLGILFGVWLEVTENLAYLFLLDLFFAGVFVVLVLSAARGGEDHVVD